MPPKFSGRNDRLGRPHPNDSGAGKSYVVLPVKDPFLLAKAVDLLTAGNTDMSFLAGPDSEHGWPRETYTPLHRRPELSLEEQEASKTTKEKLTAFGRSVDRIGGTVAVGLLKNGDGPIGLARSDLDAFRDTETTGAPTGPGHDPDIRRSPVRRTCAGLRFCLLTTHAVASRGGDTRRVRKTL